MDNYITQRLAAIGGGSEVEALKAENARLREQLGQVPQAEFKSEAQKVFENSTEFENILNAFYMRFMRDKFGAEFRNSPHIQEFQTAANTAFAEFEKSLKKEDTKNAQSGNSKKINGVSNTNDKQDS